MHLLVEAEWGLPREQDVGVVGYGEFRPPTPTYPAAVITNNPPAPEATEATRPGTVSDLAMPGEGADTGHPSGWPLSACTKGQYENREPHHILKFYRVWANTIPSGNKPAEH